MPTAPRAKRSTNKHAHYRARLRALRAALRRRGCDAALLTSEPDIRWLCPFTGEDSWAFVDGRRFVLISDFRFEEDLAHVAGLAEVVVRTGGIVEAAAAVIGDCGPRTVALQAERISMATRDALAKRAGARRLRPLAHLTTSLRAIKDEVEVAAIRKALRVQQRAFRAILPLLKPGLREVEIAAALERAMRQFGAEGASFPTIVAAGAHGSRPHYAPASAKTRAGGALLIDWGARVDGYCGDMTRTLAFSRWPSRLRDVYKVALEANEAGLSAIRPGAACRDVDAAARRVIERAGYGERFGHGLGHGVGLEVHEAPRLSRRSDETLRQGMVVTIEPGVYLPGVGGVRIEDVALVGANGPARLSSLPKSLAWATR